MNTNGPAPTNPGRRTPDSLIKRAGGSLITWFALDCVYLLAVFAALPDLPFSRLEFLIAHGLGIVIATMVMFTGLGAGVLWIPLLVLLRVKPSEAVSISIFTQIAGKGAGSFNYFRAGMIDKRVARYFIPFVCIGVALGYGAGFVISREYERLLLYLFVGVAVYLLIKMVNSLGQERAREHGRFTDEHLRKSRLIVIVSSFFTGLLSIGNSDWLIPHMERDLGMPTSRAIATGLFVMFCGSVFFLCLTALAVLTGIESWPQSSPLLLATCSGVIVGGQIGTRLVKVQWLKGYQKHAFILMLGLSIIHLLW